MCGKKKVGFVQCVDHQCVRRYKILKSVLQNSQFSQTKFSKVGIFLERAGGGEVDGSAGDGMREVEDFSV